MLGRLDHAFGTGDAASPARIGFDRLSQGAGKGFEGGFNNVVGVDAVELADVERELGVVNDRHKKFAHELGVVAANALGGKVEAVAEVGAARKVEGHLDEGFVEGREELAKADNALAIAEGLVERLAEGNAHIFVGVVIVNFPVALGAHVKVEQAVGGNLVQHVVEEGNAGVGVALAGSFEGQADAHVGFAGFAAEAGTAERSGGGGCGGSAQGLGQHSKPNRV